MMAPDITASVCLMLSFFKKLFIFDCTGSLLKHEASLVASGGYCLIVVYGLWSTGSEVVSKELSCPRAYGIFLDQELNRSLVIGKGILNHWASREVDINRVLSQLFHSPPSLSARVVCSGLFMI